MVKDKDGYLELPDLNSSRFLIRIPCQKGTLMLALDVNIIQENSKFVIRVCYYPPGTSMGYHRFYTEGEKLIVNQVDDLISNTMVSLIDCLGTPIHMTNTMALFEGNFEEKKHLIGL